MKRNARIGPLLGMLGLCLGAAACGPDDPEDVACQRQPPYRLAVTAAEGALPRSTVVHVRHGGGELDYPLANPPSTSDLMFCDEPADPAMSLNCDVWTQGAATFLVEADGYEPVEEQVALERDGACVITHDVAVELLPPES